MKLLVVEDDRLIIEGIKKTLQHLGDIDCVNDGQAGLLLSQNNVYDLIILDIMLPFYSGFDILTSVRKNSTTPIMMLTAKGELNEKVKALKSGADDYLVKPFFKEELLARVEALLRRSNKNYESNLLTFKDLKLDLSNRTCFIGNEEIILSGKLFDLLEYFIRRNNTIVTKDQIFNRIWGFESDTIISVVEVYASNLRKILKAYDYHKYLHTIRNVGYMLSNKAE